MGRDGSGGIGCFAFEDVVDEGLNEFSGVDAIEFAGFDDGEEHGHGLGAAFRVSAVPGFSADDGISE